MYCMECNHSWQNYDLLDIINSSVLCPSCGKTCKILPYKTNKSESTYFSILTTKKNFQVVRIFILKKCYSFKSPPKQEVFEVMQHWVRTDGVITTLSRKTNSMSIYYDLWLSDSDLEIRCNSEKQMLRNQIIPDRIYPSRRILPVIKRNGFKGFFHGIPFQILFSALLSNTFAETLLKSKQTSLLEYFFSHNVNITPYWPSIRIAIRNNYIVSNASLWADYIQLLSFFGKDLHSAKYVCPEKLQQSHDYYVNLKKKKDRQNREMQLQQEFETFQADYYMLKNKFFNLAFSNGNITITPLTHVSEFFEIGEAHSHCLYSNDYFKKENSLLLKAVIDNKPIETVEFSLNSLQILQCYGKFNKSTSYHHEIIDLVNANKHEILACI